MSRTLKLEFPDEVYESIEKAARQTGQTPEEWATARLRSAAPTEKEWDEAKEQLSRHIGAVDLGYPTGADNESIDRDLAREYGDSHEDC